MTSELLRSPELPEAVESALGAADERCVLDTMRLVDLLLVLLFEGRRALPRAAAAASNSSARLGSNLKRMDSAGERTHRQLIDCIRSKVRRRSLIFFCFRPITMAYTPKDTDALIEAVESGNVEVNFMDDVGQTLLNWAAAFGTQDMVEFLCQRGADVNKGQR